MTKYSCEHSLNDFPRKSQYEKHKKTPCENNTVNIVENAIIKKKLI